MEESVNTSYNQNSEQQDDNVSPTASSRKIDSIYLVVFIAVVFLALIFTLNYFNILPISSLFPNQFGFLPHKEKAVVDNKPDKESPKNQIATMPTGYIRFPYDIPKAEKILKDYVTDNIKELLVPSKIEVKQNLLTTGELRGTDYQFGANWRSDNAIFNAALHYIKNTNDLRDAEIFITPKNAQSTPVDSTNSAALIKTYLKNIPETVNFDCGVFNENIRYCENFTISDTGKSGIGVARGIDESGSDISFIFSCLFPKNDSYYEKRTSCLLFNEKDPSGL